MRFCFEISRLLMMEKNTANIMFLMRHARSNIVRCGAMQTIRLMTFDAKGTNCSTLFAAYTTTVLMIAIRLKLMAVSQWIMFVHVSTYRIIWISLYRGTIFFSFFYKSPQMRTANHRQFRTIWKKYWFTSVYPRSSPLHKRERAV